MAEIAVAEYHCCQDPWELSVLLDLLAGWVRPRLVLEIGSWYGGGLFAWRSLGAEVLAVTLSETMPQLEGHTYGAEMIWGNSHDDEMFGQDGRIAVARGTRTIDFAWIDGDHSTAGCRRDFDLCMDLGVPVIGLHDVIGDEGVRPVWADLSARFPHMLIHQPRIPDGRAAPGTGIIWAG